MTPSDLIADVRALNPAPATPLTADEEQRMRHLLERLPHDARRPGQHRTAEAEADSRPARRRALPVIGFSLLGAGALTVVLVASNVLGLAGWRGGADSAAAGALESAAVATIEASDPVVGLGQYLRITTNAVYSASTGDGAGGFTSFLDGSRDELYVPYDRQGDWVWMRHAREPVQTFGPASEAFAAEMHALEEDELLRAPAGTFYGGSPTEISGDYDALPRNPNQLLNAIYAKTLTQGQSPDGAALVWIADVLRNGTVPAELRAALYQAAARIPGVTITDQQASLDGTTGIAIGRVEPSTNIRQDIIIDPDTGQFIGEREISLVANNGLPAGTPSESTTVSITVVDTAPEGGTVYGNHPPGDQL
ncbi:CU044_5270 family protein [Herbiconiux sp. VKM Ac-2851]|uniref:CU044_5270 family protein n=1 Tax=Herbiconiux sp. VKM Ac-2851 TaxID=2739025 RepID=UPI001566F6D4|nr:CU044_5270 family protein [Herbiconiux sp. VKM Ac-2851]NQX36443.1 CU044_5270 family protein [Herbiconiux sp. VKM Ac-2851]